MCHLFLHYFLDFITVILHIGKTEYYVFTYNLINMATNYKIITSSNIEFKNYIFGESNFLPGFAQILLISA